MAKKPHDTPMLDELETGPWPSFVTGLKRLAQDKDYMVDLLGTLETSYRTKKGYWKGGTVGVFGYGGGVIPRFTELKDDRRHAGVPRRRRVPHPARAAAAGHALQHRRAAQDVRHLGEARLGPDRLPRPERRHHVPGRQDRQGAGRLRRAQRTGLRPRRRRPRGAHQHELRRRRALRAELLRRGPGPPPGDQHLPRRHPPPGAALQVQVQVQRLCQRLHEQHPALGHGRHRHLARQHAHRRGAGAQVVRQARHERAGQRRHHALPHQDHHAQGDQGRRHRATASPA
jgi:hypothetical protein